MRSSLPLEDVSKCRFWLHPRRCVRMVKMQGDEDEGAGSVVKYMTKPESDSNEADWLLWNTAWLSTKLSLVVSVVVKSNSTPTLLTFLRTRTMFKELLFRSEKTEILGRLPRIFGSIKKLPTLGRFSWFLLPKKEGRLFLIPNFAAQNAAHELESFCRTQNCEQNLRTT